MAKTKNAETKTEVKAEVKKNKAKTATPVDDKATEKLSDQELHSILSIKEQGQDSYVVRDSTVEFNCAVGDSGLEQIAGKIYTDWFFADTDIEKIRSYRYTLLNVKITNLEFDSKSDKIVYSFEAGEFEVSF